MDVNRRHLISGSAAGIAGAMAMPQDPARAATLPSSLGRDVTQFGVRPGSADDQTRILQRAIDEAARTRSPLALPPGVYRTGMLRLQSGTQLIGVRGATKLVFTGGPSLLLGEGADCVLLSGITFDGANIPLPERRGLIHCLGGRDSRIVDCEITGSGGSAVWLEQISGDVSGNIIRNTAVTAIVSFDAKGLIVSRNTITGTRRQRHRDPAHVDRRRRHAGHRQPHRGHQGRPRRLRSVRQRNQRIPRRQRHRAQQLHQEL